MRTAQARTVGVRGSGFRSIVWLLLVAFTLQSFITQIHIHRAIDGAGKPAISQTLAKAPPHGNTSDQNSTADCPFCQAITHAGAFSTPSAPGLLLPVVWVESAPLLLVADAIDSLFSHPWQSRAPPRH